ncbi:60S ribosomal protein L9 [Glycine soja]|nr:60S ribosomal protein L9 [Glycine soja]
MKLLPETPRTARRSSRPSVRPSTKVLVTNKLKNDAWFGSQKTFSTTHTLLSHIENLITGLTKGYRYKMRFVYAHFPINARIGNNKKYIEIRNFLGEESGYVEGISIV